MSELNEPTRPWQELELLIEVADSGGIEEFLDGLPPAEILRALSRLREADRTRLLTILDPQDAADLVDQMPDVQAAEAIEDLEPKRAAAIVHELPSAEQADLLGDVGDRKAEAILAAMEQDEAEEARELRRYEDDVAGGLMCREFLVYPGRATVGEVIRDLHEHAAEYRDFVVQYAYVVADRQRLVGVLRLRDLLLSTPDTPISSLMVKSPLTVSDEDSLDDLRAFFDRHHLFGVPVVDAGGRFVGIVKREEVEEALVDRGVSDHLKSQGIACGEELRSMPLLKRAGGRLSWLSVNIVLNIAAASVIALYQETLVAVIALAVFLPVISDMSGACGNQAIAVSMRELTIGLIRPGDAFRVLWKEIGVGLVNGLSLGVIIALAGWAWKGNPVLGLVIGGAMAVNTVIAVAIGGTVPLVLRRMGVDPALASGPILTTVTDICGFFLILGTATAVLPWL